MRDSCDLWTVPHAVLADRGGRFETVATYEEWTHLGRALLRCTCCGRLYFHEHQDDIDWEGGNDPSWETFVPIRGDEEIESLLREPAGAIRFEPRLHHDRDTEGRVRTGWAGRPDGPFRREGSA